MKKSIWTLAVMAGLASMGCDVPTMVKQKPKPRNCDQKKCKSCKHIRPQEKDNRRCVINHCRCAINGYTNPMNNACSHYVKRKR